MGKVVMYVMKKVIDSKLGKEVIADIKRISKKYGLEVPKVIDEGFMEKFSEKVDWYCVSEYQKLSEGFIEKFSEKVAWFHVSIYQKLSEGFIEKFSKKVNWDCVSEYQKLSEGFIEKFSKKVDWDCVSKYQKLSEGFIKKHKLEMPWRFDRLPKEERYSLIKQYCDKQKLEYDESKEVLYAYKSVRDDMYSVLNFSVKYQLGEKVKVDMCDCSNSENSYGLSAWTKEKALEYYNRGKLFKAKINFSEVGYLREDGKIRCWALTPVEEVA